MSTGGARRSFLADRDHLRDEPLRPRAPGAGPRGARVLALPLRHARGSGARGRAWRGRHGDSLPRDPDRRDPGRTTGFVCLYDAVAAVRPDGRTEAVHSCGHGPIAGGVTGAALALSQLRESLAGAVVVDRLPRRRDPRAGHDRARRRQGDQRRGRALGRCRRGPLRAPRVHRHGVARVALDAPRDGCRAWVAQPRVHRRAAARGCRSRARSRARATSRTTSCSSGSSTKATSRRRRASSPRRPSFSSGTRSRRSRRASGPCGGRSPTRPGSSGGLVEAVRPDDRVTAAVAAAFRTLGRDFVARPSPASLRDRLRQHLAPLPGCAHRRRPAGRLGVPHRRGCGGVRFAGRVKRRQ